MVQYDIIWINMAKYWPIWPNPSTFGRIVLEQPVGGGFTLPLYPPPMDPLPAAWPKTR